MQASDGFAQKNSLLNAMNRFIGAVNNMDHTVMVPSLLRDVPLDDDDDDDVKPPGVAPGNDAEPANGSANANANANGSAYFHQDMYSSYLLLKSIRNDIEWGVVQGEERRREKAGAARITAENDDVDDGDLEKRFHFHLSGLHAVLSKLTRRADTLTTRYKEEIGCRN